MAAGNGRNRANHPVTGAHTLHTLPSSPKTIYNAESPERGEQNEMLKRPVNQLTRMRAAGELAALIAQETTLTMTTETRLVKLAHKHYCTVSEIRTEYRLAASEDEAISRIYLKLAQAEAEAKGHETVKEI